MEEKVEFLRQIKKVRIFKFSLEKVGNSRLKKNS